MIFLLMLGSASRAAPPLPPPDPGCTAAAPAPTTPRRGDPTSADGAEYPSAPHRQTAF